MASEYDFNFRQVTVPEETARKIREMLADKGTYLGTIGAVSVDVGPGGSTTETDPGSAAEPMLPGTGTHMISTEFYVDSGGHVHVVTFDEHTTAEGGTVLEILSDVAIN